MAEKQPTFRQKQRMLEFANKVSALALESPEEVTKSELYSVVNSIRTRFGFSQAQKKTEVLRFIRLGCSTVADLMSETKFPRETLSQILSELESEKVARRDLISAHNGVGRGQDFWRVTDQMV